jgi:hypothetical protein
MSLVDCIGVWMPRIALAMVVVIEFVVPNSRADARPEAFDCFVAAFFDSPQVRGVALRHLPDER